MTYTNKEYADMAAKANSEGKILSIENGVLALKEAPPQTVSYREKRLAEYPTLGDMVDAICKDKLGDSGELDALIAKRNAVKAKYPKD